MYIVLAGLLILSALTLAGFGWEIGFVIGIHSFIVTLMFGYCVIVLEYNDYAPALLLSLLIAAMFLVFLAIKGGL